MRIVTKLAVAAVALIAAAISTADAQNVIYSMSRRANTPESYERSINWKPDYEVPRRYLISIHPFHQVAAGWKVDFDLELPKAGRWLQLSGTYYHRRKFDNDPHWSWREGWSTINSGDIFTHLEGFGLGTGYKQFFGPGGFYWNARLNYAHFRVGHDREGFFPFTEDGLQYYMLDTRNVHSNYDKLTADLNIGYSLAAGRHVVFDCFAGIGYTHAFYREDYSPFGDYMGFAYRGLILSFGIRVGFLWEGRRPWGRY